MPRQECRCSARANLAALRSVACLLGVIDTNELLQNLRKCRLFATQSRLTFTCRSRLCAPQRPAARSARSGIPGKALQAGHYRLCRPVWPGLARRYLLVFWPRDICSLSLSRVVGLLTQRLLYGLSCYSPDVIGAHAQSGWLVAVFFISASS